MALKRECDRSASFEILPHRIQGMVTRRLQCPRVPPGCAMSVAKSGINRALHGNTSRVHWTVHRRWQRITSTDQGGGRKIILTEISSPHAGAGNI